MELKSLSYCKNCIVRMKNAESLDEYEEQWVTFVGHFALIRNKVKNMGSRQIVPQVILSNVNAFFNTTLGKYLLHARNSYTHSIRPITCTTQNFITITAKSGGGKICGGVISGDGEINTLQTDENIEIVFNPSKHELIDVEDSNVIYNVPTTTPDGNAIKSRIPHEVADLALDCLNDILK